MSTRKNPTTRTPVDSSYSAYFTECVMAYSELIDTLMRHYKTDERGAECILLAAAEFAYFPGHHDPDHVAAALGVTRDKLDAALVTLGVLPPTPPPATSVH